MPNFSEMDIKYIRDNMLQGEWFTAHLTPKSFEIFLDVFDSIKIKNQRSSYINFILTSDHKLDVFSVEAIADWEHCIATLSVAISDIEFYVHNNKTAWTQMWTCSMMDLAEDLVARSTTLDIQHPLQ